MWHRCAKRTIGWLCLCSSWCKEVRGQPQRDRGRTSGTICTGCAKRTIGWLCLCSSWCKEVRGQPQRDRGRTLGTICTSPPRVRKTDTPIVFCLFVLYFVTCPKTVSCHFTTCFTSLWILIYVSIWIQHVMSSRVCLYLLISITSHTWAYIKYPSSLCVCVRAYTSTHTHHANTRKNREISKTKSLSLPLPKHSLPHQQQALTMNKLKPHFRSPHTHACKC